jgi:hypothetical protein
MFIFHTFWTVLFVALFGHTTFGQSFCGSLGKLKFPRNFGIEIIVELFQPKFFFSQKTNSFGYMNI